MTSLRVSGFTRGIRKHGERAIAGEFISAAELFPAREFIRCVSVGCAEVICARLNPSWWLAIFLEGFCEKLTFALELSLWGLAHCGFSVICSDFLNNYEIYI